MKKNISRAIEACALTEATTALIQIFIDDFAEHSTSKGSVTVSEESVNFIVTMRLERKKGVKKGNESKTG